MRRMFNRISASDNINPQDTELIILITDFIELKMHKTPQDEVLITKINKIQEGKNFKSLVSQGVIPREEQGSWNCQD